jgi:hypothetical protein
MLTMSTSTRSDTHALVLIDAALREATMNVPLTEPEWDALLKQVDLEAQDDPANHLVID